MAPTTRLAAPASFNAANRSLKSRFTIGAASPGPPLRHHVPHQFHPSPGRDRTPELAIELPVVGIPEEARRAGEALSAPTHDDGDCTRATLSNVFGIAQATLSSPLPEFVKCISERLL